MARSSLIKITMSLVAMKLPSALMTCLRISFSMVIEVSVPSLLANAEVTAIRQQAMKPSNRTHWKI
ncbi:hypothetical protein D3C87_1679440 [compost metagenome]